MYELESGISRQVSMIGNEGVTGMFLLLGCDSTPATITVQSPGHGYRIKANVLKNEFESGGALQRLLLRQPGFDPSNGAECRGSSPKHRTAIVPLFIDEPGPLVGRFPAHDA